MKGQDDTVVHAGWLIDGSGGPIRKDMVLRIKDGYIHDLKPAGQKNDDDLNVLDLTFCTLVPGLIDSHVHLFMSGTDDRKIRDFQLSAPFADIKGVIADHISQHLAHGVVAVRDGGDRRAHALRYKKESLYDENIPIILKVTGKAWHKPGRYGRLIGRPPEGKETLADAIPERHRRPGHRLRVMGQETADFLGITLEELRDAVADGATLAEVAEANGSSADALIDYLVGVVAEHLDEAVAEGKMTADEAAERLEQATDHITALVNGELPERPEGAGPGLGGPRGRFGGGEPPADDA